MKHEPMPMPMLKRLQTIEPAIRASVRLSEIISDALVVFALLLPFVPLNSLLIYQFTTCAHL